MEDYQDCPRCYNNSAVVCCALCGDSGKVTTEVYIKYLDLGDRYVSIEKCKEIRGYE